MELKLIGQIDNVFESANRVYSADGLSPTILAGTGGGAV